MANAKLFIASSESNIEIAKLVARKLEADGCGDATPWNEGVFSLNGSILDRLLTAINEYDFAILIWGGDDVTDSKGAAMASPRDNVIFECGLFMGALTKDRVFVMVDKHARVKIPSDFSGISLAYYDGSLLSEGDGTPAIRKACEQIALEIRRPRHSEFVGEWRSRYAKAADPSHGEVIDDLDVAAVPGGIRLSSKPLPETEPYTAHGRVYQNQIIGHWKHQRGQTLAEGVFVLVVNPMANAMYGYCSGRNEDGTMIYETWTLAKKAGSSDDKVNELLLWAEKTLKAHTIVLPLPEFGKQG
jgi:hypothetical protein